MPLDIPGHEHFVSAVELSGADLLVRLVSNYHAGTDAAAYELRASRVTDVDRIFEYMTRAKEGGEYLYAFERDDSVVFSDESGNEVAVRAATLDCRFDSLNIEEVTQALAQVQSQYEREHESERRTQAKLQRARELIYEQIRRIEVKTASHGADSDAGVLYGQQVQFLERLLRETEA